MYSEIKDLQRKGFSIRQTASILKIMRSTAKNYRDMTLEEYMDKFPMGNQIQLDLVSRICHWQTEKVLRKYIS